MENKLKNVKWKDFYKSWIFWFAFAGYWIYVMLGDVNMGISFTPIASVVNVAGSFVVAHVVYGAVLLMRPKDKH